MTLRRLEIDIKNAEGASVRRKELINSRRKAYSQIFETFVEERSILERLYAPLRRDLAGQTGTLRRLQFAVNRYVDLDNWAESGEALFDLRKLAFSPGSVASDNHSDDSVAEEFQLRGHGAIRRLAESYLVASWSTGSAEDVAAAMDGFREKFAKEMLKAVPMSLHGEIRRRTRSLYPVCTKRSPGFLRMPSYAGWNQRHPSGLE